MAYFAGSLKRNLTQLKKIGTKDVSDWMFTTWLLQGLTSEYDSFCIMPNNKRKAKRIKEKKTESDFDSILEQILNLDTQKKTSKAQSMKSASKPEEKKKSNTEPLGSCLYYTRPSHFEEQCYYKHQECASKDFR